MVLEAAAGSDVQLYVSTFYQEGGSPEFDEGIKAWLNEDLHRHDQQRRQRHHRRCHRHGL